MSVITITKVNEKNKVRIYIELEFRLNQKNLIVYALNPLIVRRAQFAIKLTDTSVSQKEYYGERHI